MRKRRLSQPARWALGLMAAAMATATWAGPDDPRLAVGRLRLDGNQVLLSFRLDNAFDEDFQRHLASGLPTPIVYRFQLVRPRWWWLDNAVESGSLQVDAMYNAVTREYLINYRHDGNLIESRVEREPEELRRAMSEFDDFPVFSLAGRAPDQRLYVRARAVLGTRTFLFFIPRTVNTDWVATRVPERPR